MQGKAPGEVEAVSIDVLPPSSTGMPLMMLPVHLLRPGQWGRVVQVSGPTDLAHRLHELGLRAGVEVQMIRSGQPCILGIHGHRLGFRADELTLVLVEPRDGGGW